ncbi:MAG: hypothetical protein NTW79_03210 [Candidatus Berkelbacteria bacterium]|nr:hypothetical protein [Candidatus Berkelbacteria bacterium]
MEEPITDNNSTNLADLVNILKEAKKATPLSIEKLKDKPKSSEHYIICKNGTVAEMDKNEHSDGKVTIKE